MFGTRETNFRGPRLLFKADTSIPPPIIPPNSSPHQILSILTPILNLYDQKLNQNNELLVSLINRTCPKCCNSFVAVQRAAPPTRPPALQQDEVLDPVIPPFPPSWRDGPAAVHRSAYSLENVHQELQAGGWRQVEKGSRKLHCDFNARMNNDIIQVQNSFHAISHKNISTNCDEVILNRITGNFLDSTASLVHCVAEDLHQACGVAVDVTERFGQTDFLRSLGKITGQVATLPIRENEYLFNLLTKLKSPHKPRRSHLRLCLWELRSLCLDLGVKHLAMPKIGSGYDRLPWDQTEDDLRMVFKGTGIQLDIYELSPEAAASYASREEARKQQRRPSGSGQPGTRRQKPQPTHKVARPHVRSPQASSAASAVVKGSPEPPRSPLRVVGVILPRPPTTLVDLESSSDALLPPPTFAPTSPLFTSPAALTRPPPLTSSPPAALSAAGEPAPSEWATQTSPSLPPPPSPAYTFSAPSAVLPTAKKQRKTKGQPSEDFAGMSTRARKK